MYVVCRCVCEVLLPFPIKRVKGVDRNGTHNMLYVNVRIVSIKTDVAFFTLNNV